MIDIRPITLQQIESVIEQAKLDDHGILAPTHIILKNREIAGCLSVGSIPMMLTWIDTRKNNKFDSARIFQTVEESLKFAGHRFVALPCSPKSPFFPLAEKAGFVRVYENNTLFIKSL